VQACTSAGQLLEAGNVCAGARRRASPRTRRHDLAQVSPSQIEHEPAAAHREGGDGQGVQGDRIEHDRAHPTRAAHAAQPSAEAVILVILA